MKQNSKQKRKERRPLVKGLTPIDPSVEEAFVYGGTKAPTQKNTPATPARGGTEGRDKQTGRHEPHAAHNAGEGGYR